MDWKKSEEMLTEMSLAYNKDNIRKITYNKEIFPLSFRFYTGERTTELYDSISSIHQQLMDKNFFTNNISKRRDVMNIMQLEILLIGVFISAFTVTGYLLGKFVISLYRKKLLSQKLNSLVKNHKLKPSKKLYFSDKLLVLDTYKKVALYLDYFNLNKVTFIELEDLKDCRLVIRSLMVRLDLIFHNPSKKPI